MAWCRQAPSHYLSKCFLTHWGRVTHICVCELTNIDSDNGLSPEWRQAIIWTNVGILLIGPSGTNVSEFLVGIHTSSFKEMHLNMSSAKWGPFCFGLNVLMLVSKCINASHSLGNVKSYNMGGCNHGDFYIAWKIMHRFVQCMEIWIKL